MGQTSWDQDAIVTGKQLTIQGVTITQPAASGTIATLANAETLTNKTLVSPATSGLTVTPATTLTATGSSSRAGALALTADTNNITTSSSGNGVILPPSTIGRVVRIYNNGAAAITVYGSNSDTIDGAAAATGVTLTNAKRCMYECVAAATWISAQLGVVSA